MPSQLPDRKLIWFQHFHKAGGSSVIRLAQRNQWKFYPNHRNANPTDDNGNWIEFWNYDRSALNHWLNAVIRANVDFIACEWGFPPPEHFITRDDLVYLTVLRDPVQRLISNFLYDLSRHHTKCPTVQHYVNLKSKWSYHQPEYYVRTLNGLSTAETITDDHLAQAIAILDRFEIVMVVEREDPWRPLEQLGWEVADLHVNVNRQRPELYAKHVTPQDVEFLEEVNRLDIALYEHVARKVAACPPTGQTPRLAPAAAGVGAGDARPAQRPS
jgi:hypothetical protein